MTPEAQNPHEDEPAGFCDCTGPYFTVLNRTAGHTHTPAGFSGTSLPKASLPCWKVTISM